MFTNLMVDHPRQNDTPIAVRASSRPGL